MIGDGSDGATGDGAGGSAGAAADGGTSVSESGVADFPVDEAFAAQLVAKGFPADIARFFAGARLEASSPDPHTYLYKQTFPNGATREITMVFTPASYTPTADELARAGQGGPSVFAFKATITRAADVPTIALSYFVPRAQIPAELAARLDGMDGPIHQPLLLQQAGGGGGSDGFTVDWTETGKKGADVSIGTLLDYAKEMGRSVPGLGSIYALGSALSDVATAAELSGEVKGMLAALDALDKCAHHPTNMLALQDPNYIMRTANAIDSARSELNDVSATRFLNIMTETAAGLTPATAALSVAMKQGFAWNEQTLKDFSHNTILDEITKMVIKCDPMMPGQGNVDMMSTCGEAVSGSSVETKHAVSMVSWMYDPTTTQYTAVGTVTYEHIVTIYGPSSSCQIKGMGTSNTLMGMLTYLDNPLVASTLGYNYLAAGGADVMMGTVNGCANTSTTMVESVDWLPLIKGFTGTGGAISGTQMLPFCMGGTSNGSLVVNYDFMLPPKK